MEIAKYVNYSWKIPNISGAVYRYENVEVTLNETSRFSLPTSVTYTDNPKFFRIEAVSMSIGPPQNFVYGTFFCEALWATKTIESLRLGLWQISWVQKNYVVSDKNIMDKSFTCHSSHHNKKKV